MSNKKTPEELSGEPLRSFLRTEDEALRQAAGIRIRDKVPTRPAGQGAQRYFGKNLIPLAGRVRAFFAETMASGAYKGLRFTVADYDKAITREGDTHETDTALHGLAQDAHAEHVAARAKVADMTMKIIQTRDSIIGSPGADDGTKAHFKAAGAKVDAEVTSMKSARKGSRAKGATLRGTQEALSQTQAELKQYQTGDVVREAQKDLRLQFLAGEPLRPEDLVVAGGPDEAPAPVRARTTTRSATVAAPRTPAKEKGRRKSPRG